MKINFTTNEFKKVNKSMFNIKMFSLMKKQFFSFVIMLALVVLAGTSAWAQAGMTPGAPYQIAIGSTANFEVGTLAGNTYAWDVFELANNHVIGAAAGATVVGTKVAVTTPAANATDIRFYATPNAGNVFVVQSTETESPANGSCSTIRRFYVSVFDFEVDVIPLAVNVAAAPAAPGVWNNTWLQDCNSWSGDVIKNTLDSTFVRSTMNADSVNNPTANENKYTDSYFALRVTITGATLDDYKSRVQWSMDTTSNLRLYQMEVTSGTARFNAEGAGGAVLWGAAVNADLTEPTTYRGDIYNDHQTLYFAKTTGAATQTVAVIRVRSHNMLGEADMQFNLKVDRVQLEKTDAATDYNNGTKYNQATLTASTDLARLNGTNDISASITVRQSPATNTIGVID